MTSPSQDSGERFFHLPVLGEQGGDKLLEAVRDYTEGELEVFGEIGRGANGSIVYLARVLAKQGSLIILRLDPCEEPNTFDLDRLQTLDSTVPSKGLRCPNPVCGTVLPGFGNYCPMCSTKLGVTTEAPAGWDQNQLLQAVREFAIDEYDVLGSVPRTEGDGHVFFARDRKNGDITALRLEPKSSGGYQVGLTGVLPRIARIADQQHPPRNPVKPTVPPPPKTGPPPPITRPVAPMIDQGGAHPGRPAERTRPQPASPPQPPKPRLGNYLGVPDRPQRLSLRDVGDWLGDSRVGLVLLVLVVLLLFVIWLT